MCSPEVPVHNFLCLLICSTRAQLFLIRPVKITRMLLYFFCMKKDSKSYTMVSIFMIFFVQYFVVRGFLTNIWCLIFFYFKNVLTSIADLDPYQNVTDPQHWFWPLKYLYRVTQCSGWRRMTRHGLNATNSSVYSYHERKRDQQASPLILIF